MIATLVERKERGMGTESGRRTKRARKGPKPCSLHEIELTVSELGLGYESDETVRFRYCSGKCTHERRNYDFVMEHMQLNNGSSEKGRRGRDNGKKDKARYTPCCRPIKFEKKMSFFDNNDKFYTIQNVSARACGCVWHFGNYESSGSVLVHYHGNGGYLRSCGCAEFLGNYGSLGKCYRTRDSGTKTKGKLQFSQMLKGVWYANMEQIKATESMPFKRDDRNKA